MTDPTPGRIAAALAHACGLGWGAWALGLTATSEWWAARTCRYHDARNCPRCYWAQAEGSPSPVPDPLDADAYRADCARRCVEPGPLPSLSWVSDDGRIEWHVNPVSGGVDIDVGECCISIDGNGGAIGGGFDPGGSADLTELARLVAVADAARR